MKKIIVILLLLPALFSNLNAQEQNDLDVGLRLGYPLSLSLKYFVADNHAVEAYVGTRGWYGYRWTNVSAAYQIHNDLDIDLSGNFTWYYGFGGSVYFWNWNDYYYDRYNSTSFGIQGYLGLDYHFENSRINISLDWAPSVFVNGYRSGFGAGYGGLAVRYSLSR